MRINNRRKFVSTRDSRVTILFATVAYTKKLTNILITNLVYFMQLLLDFSTNFFFVGLLYIACLVKSLK